MIKPMLKKASQFRQVLSYQNFGFLVIITLCWLNSLLGLPSLIFEGRFGVADFESPVLQMLLILAVWLLVNSSTQRSLERFRHLENFLRICAWCHRINHKGDWKTMEKYFEEGFDTSTTHGICPCCLEKQTNLFKQQKRARKNETRHASMSGDLNRSVPALPEVLEADKTAASLRS